MSKKGLAKPLTFKEKGGVYQTGAAGVGTAGVGIGAAGVGVAATGGGGCVGNVTGPVYVAPVYVVTNGVDVVAAAAVIINGAVPGAGAVAVGEGGGGGGIGNTITIAGYGGTATVARGVISQAYAGASAVVVVADKVGVSTGSVTAATISPASVDVSRFATVDIREAVG
eukprot:XP_014788791.1 PREDICTED: uncharacterized PE-PGRS family protein PE_PGRS24-like [Octopus bimaculoides]